MGRTLLGAGAGAVVAQRVAKATTRAPGLAVGALVLAAALYNMWAIAHPAWFMAAAVVGLVAVTLLASTPRAPSAAGA